MSCKTYNSLFLFGKWIGWCTKRISTDPYSGPIGKVISFLGHPCMKRLMAVKWVNTLQCRSPSEEYSSRDHLNLKLGMLQLIQWERMRLSFSRHPLIRLLPLTRPCRSTDISLLDLRWTLGVEDNSLRV